MTAMAPRAGLILDSAGTGGWHVGEPPYGPMQAAAHRRGYDLSALRARQFAPEDFTRFDLILAMDDQNLRDIEAQRPVRTRSAGSGDAGSDAVVRLFTDYLGADWDLGGPDGGGTERNLAVPDPYYTRDFDGAIDLIEGCARGLLGDLAAK